MSTPSLRIAVLLFLLLGGMQTSCEKEHASELDRGMAHLKRGEYDMAVWYLNIHLRKNAGHAEAYAHRGTAKNSKGDLEGAIVDFDRALELNPDLRRVYFQRGLARAQHGDPDGAIDDLGSAIEFNPKNTDAYYYRANIRAGQGDLDGAIADYTRALQFDPTGALIYFNRGIAHYLRKDWARARGDFDAAARQQDPQRFGLLYSFVLQSRLGESEAARDGLREARERIESGHSEKWFSTLAGFLLGELDEAALLSAAQDGGLSQARNQLCEAWYFAGMARLFAGQDVEAANCFRRSVGTGRTNYAEHSFSQAELDALEGKAADAVRVSATRRGKIHRVNATSILLRERETGRVSAFEIHPRALVTLDGSVARMDRIQQAMDATVTLDADGRARTIDVVSRK
ncbi:MAG: tetratricopeptide repeat protein [Chthoniobacteraceae bacterium]